MDIEFVRSRFIKHFDGTTGSVYTSPGRINLIGEHTDYNGGFVFPGAVDKGMVAEIKPNGKDKVCAYSIDLKDYVEFGLNEEDAPKASWARYIFGVCREMIKRGVEVKGFNTAFAGDVPLGAGMSSSAALESTYAYALNDLFGDNKIDKFELAKVGQATEHNYCGVNCGIMDQFASVFGKKGSLIRLDCRSLEYQYFPFDPKGYRLVLVFRFASYYPPSLSAVFDCSIVSANTITNSTTAIAQAYPIFLEVNAASYRYRPVT